MSALCMRSMMCTKQVNEMSLREMWIFAGLRKTIQVQKRKTKRNERK